MTTAIRDAAGKGRSWIIRDADTHVSITGSTSDGTIDRASLVDRAEFLAAVADGLDVIVTPRSDLPEVTSTYAGGLRAIHRPTGSEATIRAGDTAADVHSLALCYLAIAEHLEQNPPIDEAAVDALADLIIEADGTESVTQKLAIRRVARELVKAGVRMDGAK